MFSPLVHATEEARSRLGCLNHPQPPATIVEEGSFDCRSSLGSFFLSQNLAAVSDRKHGMDAQG